MEKTLHFPAILKLILPIAMFEKKYFIVYVYLEVYGWQEDEHNDRYVMNVKRLR